jgi:Flp pilus assembly pilin Flp
VNPAQSGDQTFTGAKASRTKRQITNNQPKNQSNGETKMSPFLTLWTYLQIKTTDAYEAVKANQKNEQGVVAIEYVILGGLIVLALAAVFVVFGPKLTAKFSSLL